MSDDNERRCYATMRGTRLSLNDDLECFEDGESLVIIAESEYDEVKSLYDAVKAFGATGEALLTTKTKYYAMERFIESQGFEVDIFGNVTMRK